MINLNPATVRKIFEESKDQHEVLIGLYRLVFPYWDQITELKGYPSISDRTWEEIAELSIAFDRIHHPDVIAGGNWMNRGFAIDDTLHDWIISLASCEVTLIPNLVEVFEEK